MSSVGKGEEEGEEREERETYLPEKSNFHPMFFIYLFFFDW